MGWTTPPTFATNDVITAANLNTYIRDNQNFLKWIFVRQTEEETIISSTTFINLTGMKFPVLSGETWVFIATIFLDAIGTADVKFKATIIPRDPTETAATTTTSRCGVSTGNGLLAAGGCSGAIDDSLSVATTDVPETAVVTGSFTAAVDGDLQIMAAQNTSIATTSTYFQTSSMIALRLSA